MQRCEQHRLIHTEYTWSHRSRSSVRSTSYCTCCTYTVLYTVQYLAEPKGFRDGCNTRCSDPWARKSDASPARLSSDGRQRQHWAAGELGAGFLQLRTPVRDSRLELRGLSFPVTSHRCGVARAGRGGFCSPFFSAARLLVCRAESDRCGWGGRKRK